MLQLMWYLLLNNTGLFSLFFSISMRTVDSFGSSQTDSFGGSFFDSQTLTTSQTDPSQFEEIIDLTVSNKTLKSQQLQDRLLNHSEDLLNLNNIDNNCMSSSTNDATTIPGKPIIAFEDNASRRQDVPGMKGADEYLA